MSKSAWSAVSFVTLCLLGGLVWFFFGSAWTLSPQQTLNHEVAKQIKASLTFYQSRVQSLGKRQVVPLNYIATNNYLSMSTENDVVGYILDNREHYFKDLKQGDYACALFFRAATWEMHLPVQTIDTEGLVNFSGYLAQGSRNSGLGGCRFLQQEEGVATGQELYYSSNDGSVYIYERTS